MEIANKTVKITKLVDEKFNNQHPNSINEGFTRTGKAMFNPAIDQSFIVTYDGGKMFRTSTVLKIDEEKMQLQTLNSIYQLEVVDNE